MKRFYIILVFLILLSGCATYKVQKNKPSDEGGFVVSRYGKVIPEYTLGVNNSFPDKERAYCLIYERRFKRILQRRGLFLPLTMDNGEIN